MAPLVAAIKAVPVASFIILALVWLNSREPVPVHLGADGVPAGVPECAGGHLAARTGSFWKWPGCSACRSPAAAAGHLPAGRCCPISARRCLWAWAFAGRPGQRRRSSACPPGPWESGCTPPRSTSRRRISSRGRSLIVAVSVVFERLFLASGGRDWWERRGS